MSVTETEEKPVLEPENWVDRYSDYLFTYASLRINRKDIAEDLVQDTFLAAWKARMDFQNKASEKTWLTSILKNKIVDHYRKSSTRNELTVFDNPNSEPGLDHFFNTEGGYEGHWTDIASPQNWKKDLHNSLEAEEFQRILKDCLGKLPERTRTVFAMKVIDGEQSETICKALDITPSNFWVLMHRGKLQLRECLEMNWAKV